MKILNRSMLLAILSLTFFSLTVLAQVANCGNQDYNCKIAEYTKQIAADPDIVEAYYNRGLAFDNSGKTDQAIADFSKYIAMNPAKTEYLADGYNHRAISYKKKGLLDLAMADYNQAIQLAPTNPTFYHTRAIAHSAKKDFDLAIADFSYAISLKADYSGAYLGN